MSSLLPTPDLHDPGLAQSQSWVEFVEEEVSLDGKCGLSYIYRTGLDLEAKFLVTALMVASDN